MEYNTVIKQIIILIIFSMSLITVSTADNITHITYMSFVDPELGFYKVIDTTTHQPSEYIDHILTINQGDTVIWKNDADSPNIAITVISDQHLFPDAILQTNTDVFPYVFNQGGTYTFYIGEHTPSTQIIMVRPIGTPIPTTPSTTTPSPTGIAPITILNYDPIDTIVNNSVDENRTFNITTNRLADITWQLNGQKVQYDVNVDTSNYTGIASVPGISVVNVIAYTTNGSTSREWKWNIIKGSIENTTVDIPIGSENNSFPSLIQIMSMIVVILSIYITYRTGKDKE